MGHSSFTGPDTPLQKKRLIHPWNGPSLPDGLSVPSPLHLFELAGDQR